MRTISLYLKCIFASHKYLLFSIPLIAVIVFMAGLYFASKPVFSSMMTESSSITNDILINMASLDSLRWSVILVIGLPFFHFMLLPKLFYKSYDFILPISSTQKLTAYVLLALIISLYNYLIVLALNYAVEVFFRYKYWDAVIQAFDRKGFLYTTIEEDSIFFNGSLTLKMLPHLIMIFILFPIFLFSAIFFRKYSLLISAGILVIGIFTGSYIGRLLWEGYSKMISNPVYLGIHNWAPILISTLLCYIGFYYFLKEKEV